MKRLNLLLLLFLGGCAVGPNYKRSTVDSSEPPPTDWKWQKADPRDLSPRGDWWTLYDDSQLNHLESQAMAGNHDLGAALARVDKARAQARLNGASFFPQLSLDADIKRERLNSNNPMFSQFGSLGGKVPSVTTNSFNVPIDLSYEVDLWGRVRRSFESAQDLAQAAVADTQSVLLTLQADVAVNYFTLREYDTELKILRETRATRQKSLEINQKRLQAGRATALDIEQAKTELANSEVDLAEVAQNRAQTQNALAVLCGAAASNFSIAESPLDLSHTPPEVPVGLPSSLLERRPDVAEAERTMASRNAQIGVAYAAYFPTVNLTGQYGYFSASASNLFTKPSNVWSLGPTITVPLFTGGQTTANVKSARADYEVAVENYRGVVLGAFRDVEDSLSARHFLAQRSEASNRAVMAANQSLHLSEERYKSGTINYFEVTEQQRIALTAQRTQAQTEGQRFYASVRLIKALGGGWNSAALRGEQPAPYPVLPMDSAVPSPKGTERH